MIPEALAESNLRYEVRRENSPYVLSVWRSIYGARAALKVEQRHTEARIVIRGTAAELTALGARPVGVGAASTLMLWIDGADYECVVWAHAEVAS